MSDGPRRPLHVAAEDADAFRALFSGYADWIVAGSVRRRCETVGDVEHVVVGPKVFEQLDAMIDADGLFAAPNPAVSKAVYPGGTHRWGDRYRGVMFRGFRHELFMADRDNVGAILAIRTGPADYSRWLVTELRRRGTPMEGGYVRHSSGAVLPCESEAAFFMRCGVRWVEPHKRVPQEAST